MSRWLSKYTIAALSDAPLHSPCSLGGEMSPLIYGRPSKVHEVGLGYVFVTNLKNTLIWYS